jgi:hypothetical protein
MMKNAIQIQFNTISGAKVHIFFELHNKNRCESVRAYAIFAGRLPSNCWKAKDKVLEGLLKNGGIFGMPQILREYSTILHKYFVILQEYFPISGTYYELNRMIAT